MFVRHKLVKGNRYYYLVEGRRDGKRVRQRVINYLGKHPWAYLSPTRFAPTITKDYQQRLIATMLRLGCRSVTFDLPYSDSTLLGQTDLSTNTVQLRHNASTYTLAHEFGHVIDRILAEASSPFLTLRSEQSDFLAFRAELVTVADYVQSTRSETSKDKLANLYRWRSEHPEQETITRHLHSLESFYTFYAYEHYELFADLFSLCLTQPRKARQLAPTVTDWLMRHLYEPPDLRDALTSADLWELGTTRRDEAAEVC